MSNVEQKRAFNKLKHDLEPYRHVLVHADALLTWQKQYYGAVVGAAVTAFFLALWCLDFSVITLISLAVLLLIVLDATSAYLLNLCFGTALWTTEHESHFDRVCMELFGIKSLLTGWYELLFNSKERKSTMFVISIGSAMLFLAWIGAVINNLFLCYIITLTLALYPGIRERKVFNELKDQITGLLRSKCGQLRDKIKKTD